MYKFIDFNNLSLTNTNFQFSNDYTSFKFLKKIIRCFYYVNFNVFMFISVNLLKSGLKPVIKDDFHQYVFRP